METANARPPRRLGLVIGNKDYTRGLPQLASPVNDATDLDAALRQLGFEVTLKGPGESCFDRRFFSEMR